MLGDIASNDAARLSEFRTRKSRYEQRTFRKDEAEYAVSQGWELVRENQSTLRYQKLRPHDAQLENEVWCLLYQFGYSHLSVGRGFTIETSSTSRTTVAKQIDVFAFDDETVIVAECKSSEQRSKRALQKDLGEFSGNQKPISNTLRRYFKGEFKQKIIWLFVTRNIEWSETDRARAAEANIQIVTENEFTYYKEIAKRVGRAARFQFQAEFLAGTKVKVLGRKVFALRTMVGKHRAYTFFASASTVLPVAFVNHRDLRDPNSAPSYQRLMLRPRLKDIAAFIKAGGYFPNSVILNFKQKPLFDLIKPQDEHGVGAGELTLPDRYKSAYVIDGQHRLYGYTERDEGDPDPHLPFLAFDGLPIGDETRIFSDINSKQKSVSKKLLDEIIGEIKLDSVDKREQMRAISARSFDLMRDDEDGPLGDKIAGVELKRSEDSVLTIPYLVDATLQSGLLGKMIQGSGSTTYVQGPLLWDTPSDAISALHQLLSGFFSLFRNANAERWDAPKVNKFCSNPGAAGLIRFIGDVIAHMATSEHEEPRALHAKEIVERIEKYVSPVLQFFKNASDRELDSRFQVPFGGGGPRVFQHRLRELVRLEFASFDPPGFAEDLRRYDETRRKTADEMVRTISEGVHRFVIDKLGAIYGVGDENLRKGVDNKEILKKAFDKQLEDDPPKPLGTYFDFIDLRRIVETPKNWEHFKPQLDILLPEEHKNRKGVAWFNEINKVRRVGAHPYNRGYDDTEFTRIELIYDALEKRSVVVRRQ